MAKVITPDEALCGLIICYGDAEEFQQTTGTLDHFGGDSVSLMLGASGDKRPAHKFTVSTSGVRGDSRLLDEARYKDYSFDGVWFADANVNDWDASLKWKLLVNRYSTMRTSRGGDSISTGGTRSETSTSSGASTQRAKVRGFQSLTCWCSAIFVRPRTD